MEYKIISAICLSIVMMRLSFTVKNKTADKIFDCISMVSLIMTGFCIGQL